MTSLTKRGSGSLRTCYRPEQKNEFYGVNMDAITKAIFSKNPSRTFLFHGITGTGKTSAARFCAMLINCKNGDGENPCLQCDSCKAIQSGDQQLVRELNMADKTGIDATRKEMMTLNTKPFRKGDKKILILDEAQQLTNAAQQGWLKTFEEPPPWAYIFLCTTEPESFTPAVFNRLTAFQFYTLMEGEAVEFIVDLATNEGLEIDATLAKSIFQAKGGSPRELINAIETIKLQGVESIAGMMKAESHQETTLKQFISGLSQGAALGWVVTTYYDLINQIGSGESLRRAIGKYAEKAIRGEARKEKAADSKRIAAYAKILVLVQDPIEAGTEWSFIARLAKSRGI